MFNIWKIVEKIERDTDRLLLVWKMKKSLNLEKSIGIFCFIIKIKSSLHRPFLSSLPFAKCYVLWIQTCRNLK